MVSIEERGKSGFSFKTVLVAVVICIFLAITSSYIALKLGAMPWPIIFSVIASAGLLRIIQKKFSEHDVNVASAGGSVGGLMASAVVFTIPGIWFLQKAGNDIAEPGLLVLMLIFVLAGILGVIISVPLRRYFVDKEKLAYPSGTAGAEVIKTGRTGGKIIRILLIAGLLAGVFAMTRDLFFPAGFTLTALSIVGIFITLYPMPLAAGVGYIIGYKGASSWFYGAVLGWIILIPFLFLRGFEPSSAISAIQNAGMGLVLGAGVGFFVVYVFPNLKKIFAPVFKSKDWYLKLAPWISLGSVAVLWIVGVPLLASVLSVLGVWVMATIASRMTGETDIDPLEQFGIIIVLLCAFIYSVFKLNLSALNSFIIVAFVSAATAIAGDIGHDYKSAKIIGTRVKDIIKVDLISVIVAGITAPLVLIVIKKGYLSMMFTQAMPAPQAQLVAGSIAGFAHPNAFLIGFVAAFLWEILNFMLKKHNRMLKLSMMPFGIGMFLGLSIAIPLAVGGFLRLLVEKKRPSFRHTGTIIAAGIMGGEGIAGFGVAALFVSGVISYAMGAWIIGCLFAIGAIITGIRMMKK